MRQALRPKVEFQRPLAAHGHGAPSKEVIWALEEGAGYEYLGASGPAQAALGKNRHEVLDSFILGFARFQVGRSARFNDLQHVHPKDLVHSRVEGLADEDSLGGKDTASRRFFGGHPSWPQSGGWWRRRRC